MNIVNIGILGMGAVATRVHVPALKRISGVRIAAFAEAHGARRQTAAALIPKAEPYEDYHQLLQSDCCEAVLICLPNHLHAAAAIEALEHQKHIYLEKPLATSVAEATRVIAVWESSARVGMIGFNYRHNILYCRLKARIAAGEVGKVLSIRSVFCSRRADLPEWKQTRQTGGGVIFDLASHHIDLIRFLTEQSIVEVSANITSNWSEDDHASLQMKLSGGAHVQCFFSIGSVQDDRVEVLGETGKLTVDRYSGFDVLFSASGVQESLYQKLTKGMRAIMRSPYLRERFLSRSYEPSYRAALEQFIAAIRQKREAVPNLLDGLASLQIAEAAMEANRSRRSIAIDGDAPALLQR
jgi:predicted dehydrogenase